MLRSRNPVRKPTSFLGSRAAETAARELLSMRIEAVHDERPQVFQLRDNTFRKSDESLRLPSIWAWGEAVLCVSVKALNND